MPRNLPDARPIEVDYAPLQPAAASVRYGAVRLCEADAFRGSEEMRTLLTGLAALAASALITLSPATAQRHGGMGGMGGMRGGTMMHQFHGGNFHGGMGRNFHGNFRDFRGFHRGFRGRAVIFPGWGWGWGWGWPAYYDGYYDGYDDGYCPRWWWDGRGWRCAW